MSLRLNSLLLSSLLLSACDPSGSELETSAELDAAFGTTAVNAQEALFTTKEMPEGYRALFVTLGPPGMQCDRDLLVYTNEPATKGQADTRYITLGFSRIVGANEPGRFQDLPLVTGTYAHATSCEGACELRFAADWLIYDASGNLRGQPDSQLTESGSATLLSVTEGDGGEATGRFEDLEVPEFGTLRGTFRARWCPPPSNG